MPQGKNNVPKRVLLFSNTKRLIGVFQSQVRAAKALNISTPAIAAACNGKLIACGGYYLRWWNPDVEIDFSEELGTLSLIDYDVLCADPRITYQTKKMSRRELRLSYNTKMTPEKKREYERRYNQQIAERDS